MVTQQQPDIETPTPTSTPPSRSRRGPLIAAAVAVVVILAGVGIAYAMGAFESDSDTAAKRLAVATELVDTWAQGWEGRNPELVMSAFTDDGIDITPGADRRDFIVTVENMEFFIVSVGRASNFDRIGDLTPSGDNTYTWVQEFDYSASRQRGDMEIELEGNLAKRIEWLHGGYQPIGPRSDS